MTLSLSLGLEKTACARVVNALRGLAHSFGELSKAHRTAQSAIHEYSVELEHSEQPHELLGNFPALFGDLESLESVSSSFGKSKAGAKAKSGAAGGDDEADGVDTKRKRGPNKEKRVKDPNAPKRPASAYIEFQNSVREEFRAKHSDLPYSDVLKKIGHAWAALSDEAKKPYHDIMEAKKASYLEDKKAYEAEHGPPQMIPATQSAEPKEYTGKKRGRKSNAERAAMAAAAAAAGGAGAGAAPESSAPKQPADIPVDAPSKKTVEESDDDSDDDSEDDSEDSSEDDSDESEAESSPVPVAPSKKDKKPKVEKPKAKKAKLT
ncbi:hypothetical protein JCM10212_001595 [Sporobolomyces blumeae]